MHDPRAHRTLVHKEWVTQTSKIPPAFWEPWVFLMSEALRYEHTHRQAELRLLIETSFSVDGWGAQRLVEAMNGETADEQSPAAGLVLHVPAAGALDTEANERPRKRRGILGRG